MNWIFRLFALGSLAASTLTLFAAQITTDYDHQANFAQYKTYNWLKVQAGDQLWEDRIQRDIDSELAAKGWTKVDSGGSASVSAFESTKDQDTLETFYDGLGGGGWGWRGFRGGFGGTGLSTTTTEVTRVGTLVVDIFDSQDHKLLWRGKQSDALSSNPGKNEKKLASDLKRMFRNFPPHS
ncbi:MAG: DUF4136 domain-containing protein [Terracidiphilus sp.]|jgi:hypothetical protein